VQLHSVDAFQFHSTQRVGQRSHLFRLLIKDFADQLRHTSGRDAKCCGDVFDSVALDAQLQGGLPLVGDP
jgi:hypothetical protein